MKHKLLGWFIVVCLSLPIIYPFLQGGYFPTHDGEWAIVRLAEMHREIRDGQIPPRWASYLNHGYGYPLFLFTYPFPYYLAEMFHLLGFSLTTSIKAVYILSVLGSAITMFLFANWLWGGWGALLSSIAYLYAPYRMINLFVRGSIGESLAFVFYPLLLWLISQFKEKQTPRLVATTALTQAVFLLTHNASAILFAPVLLVWIWFIWLSLSKRAKISLCISLGSGILISAYFWLPALSEKKYIALSLTPLADKMSHFVSIQELFSNSWHFGTRPPLTFGIILGILGVIGWFILNRHKQSELRKLGWVLGGLTGLSLLMLFSISYPIWQLPLLREIDFPWRTLSVVSFLMALLSGAIALKIKIKFILVLSVVLLVGLHMRYIQTQPRMVKPDEYYATNDATTTSVDELLPIWVKNKPTYRPDLIYRPQTLSAKVSVQKETSTTIELLADTAGTALILNKIYFPGWKAYVDNQEVPIETVERIGLIRVPLTFGEHQVRFSFKRTSVRTVADLLSMFGVGVLALYLWKSSNKF